MPAKFRSRPAARLLAAGVVLWVLPGACRKASRPESEEAERHGPPAGARERGETARSAAPREVLYGRVTREVAAAILLKPRLGHHEASRPLEVSLAPLIVQALGEGLGPRPSDPQVDPDRRDPARGDRFGALVSDRAGAARVDASRPVIYFSTSRARLRGRDHEQISYLWFYPRGPTAASGRWAGAGASRGPGEGGGPGLPRAEALNAQGVRLTLDREGFPAVMEVLADTSGLLPIYVSRRLEEAAAAEHGEPLPGRRHAVERSLEEEPRVVVPRVLSEGPVPMGPFAYLLGGSRDTLTLLCRCMESQVEEVRENVDYELVSLESLAGEGTAVRSWPPEEPAGVLPSTLEEPGREAPDWLERCLRLPAGF